MNCNKEKNDFLARKLFYEKLKRTIVKIRHYKFFKWIKQEDLYLDEHPEIADDLRETEEINLLRSVCGDCPDFYTENCPRDPMLCCSMD